MTSIRLPQFPEVVEELARLQAGFEGTAYLDAALERLREDALARTNAIRVAEGITPEPEWGNTPSKALSSQKSPTERANAIFGRLAKLPAPMAPDPTPDPDLPRGSRSRRK